MTDFSSLPVDKLLREEGFACGCGRMHKAYPLRYLAIASDCLDRVIDALEQLNVKKPFVIMGEHGRAAAGLRVMDALSRAGIGFSSLLAASAAGSYTPCANWRRTRAGWTAAS